MQDENSKILNDLQEIKLKDLVTQEYRAYQLYTLMDRAIPYLVDGLKPSQRRILYTLFLHKNKGLLKVSSATGLVLTLHPHGPPSIESSIVNMAQDYTFSNNYPLIDKKGYFGERMETTPAASRYIECKLSEITQKILFDDMNQVPMVPNYDEREMEPLFLLPKLPMMLLNGAEGIGTGYSSMIPSFHHKDIIESMVEYIRTGKVKPIKPWFDNYNSKVIYDKEKQRYIFSMKFEKIQGKYFITELPRGFDAKKIISHLNKMIELDIIKDYTDASVKNDVKIELIFKRGEEPSLNSIETSIGVNTSIVPNYTLISDNGVEIYDKPEEILELFTDQRIKVVQKRYELLLKDALERIKKNNEIIRFIKEKHYAVAEKKENRQEYTQYLISKKFQHFDYLADLPVYRMTKEEVKKRELLIDDDSNSSKEYAKIAKSMKLVKDKLIEELEGMKELLSNYLREKNKK
jgi:DNA gyrase subunit A